MGDVQGQGGQPRDPGGSVPPPGYTPPPQPPQQPVPAQAPVASTPMTSGSGITFYEDDGKPLKHRDRSLITPIRVVIVLLLVVPAIFVALRYELLAGDGKVDDADLPYSYEYPRNFKEANADQRRIMPESQGVDVTVVGRPGKVIRVSRVAFPKAAQYPDATSPALRSALAQAFSQASAEVGVNATAESAVTTVAGQPALSFEATQGDLGAVAYFFLAGGYLYMIDCEGKDGFAEIEGACNKVTTTFKLKESVPAQTS